MNRLLSRFDSGYWSTFSKSQGDIDTASRFGDLHVWFAKGPALRKFEDEIRDDLHSVIKNCDLPTTQELFLRLYMVGKTQEQIKPMIVVCCVDPKIRKQAKTAIERSAKLKKFPAYGLTSSALPLESTGILKRCHGVSDGDDLQRDDETILYSLPHSTLVGRRLMTPAEDGGYRIATAGPVIRVGDKVYQTTVGHLLCPDESDSQVPEQDFDLDECDLVADFEADADFTECFGIESLGLGLTEEEQPYVDGVDDTRNVIEEVEFRTSNKPSRGGIKGCVLGDSSELDYALVELDAPSFNASELSNAFRNPAGTSSAISTAAPPPTQETKIVALTSRGALSGTFIPGPMSRRARGSSTFHNVYTVKLDGTVEEGDCGSAVIDQDSGHFYGHVVLGCPGDSFAYLIAATDIFDDIRAKFGAEVRLGEPLTSSEPQRTEEPLVNELSERFPPKRTVASGQFRLNSDQRIMDQPTAEEWKHYSDGYVGPSNNPSLPRLSSFSIFLLIINRMIGTGVFSSPGTVLAYTGSAIGSTVLWLVGGLIAAAGSVVFAEYAGVVLPSQRRLPEWEKTSIPRSGGEKQFPVYTTWAHYSGQRSEPYSYSSSSAWRRPTAYVALFVSTMLLAFGNLSGNSLSFAYSVLSLGTIQSDFYSLATWLVITVQVIIVALAFTIHYISRRGGIWLNNVFAILKIGLLTLIIIVGLWASLSRAPKQGELGSNYWRDPGLMSSGGHRGNNQGSSGLVGALLAIIFSYVGFEQLDVSSHVGDSASPKSRRNARFTNLMGIGAVTLVYIAAGLYHAAATVTNDLGVPTNINNTLIDNSPWAATISPFRSSIPLSPKWFYAALALSSFGNIIAMTFTIARVVWRVRDAFCERPLVEAQAQDLGTHQSNETYDETTPQTVAQWWCHDRRIRAQWSSFWIALVAVVMTIFLGLIHVLGLTGIVERLWAWMR